MAKDVLSKDNIKLNVPLTGKEEAIRFTGEILVNGGYVDAGYIDKMFEREEMASTYMGNFLAIPHGTEDAKKNVFETGISVVTVPEGIDFGGGNLAKIFIGIAGKGNEHLEILSNIAIVCSEEENIEKILNARSEEEILDLFSEVG
ncbi:PTS mannitol transporter subunit IIA [Planococcus glaciei]|uniref:Mannitol-specific phosphotransferase enzyme IIA component n=2 Tax=Planococcus TaxID=1372 RepID=A0A1G8FHB2_9BACL|nr:MULTISPECIES: PTS sugar transporter subunit IIA [Planococcus]ETP69820.1 PTS mannitol transporter subunit IIA [Planococcus glaciei CHR43]KOF09858.1 PTS mannitol transporter subunit IIA [Planococcus glaciei]MBX0315873.1 PTS sugar transporter subunit IIA [Planococcus glaciei]MDN7228112.1 PTS sugar transporter subunit IIA [Planococcus sp. N064]QKX52125.1 PTS sugar transporter subunit IIA [Planococcus glaciei]